MERQRIFGIAVVAVIALGILLAVGGGMQRDAWMEGYTIGRLTAAAGVDGALAPAAPYMPYAYPQRGPGFGGFFFLLLGGAALFFIFTRFLHMARWRAWAMQGGAPGAQGEWHGGPPPWMGKGGPWGCGHGHAAPEVKAEAPAPAAAPAEESQAAR